MQANIRKRSIRIANHLTSVSLEDAFWQELSQIAQKKALSLNQLITQIDNSRDGNLSSAIRVFVLQELKGENLSPPSFSLFSGESPENHSKA